MLGKSRLVELLKDELEGLNEGPVALSVIS